jgi:uncharacterized protein (TIGR02996 family)
MKPDLDQPLQTNLPLRADLPAEQLRAFLDAVAVGPETVEAALVFADWLEEHGDARGQAVRWSAWKDSHSRGSHARKALAGKLHAWIDHFRIPLTGTEKPGGTLEWHRGLLRIRANAAVLPARARSAFAPAIWDLIDSGWIGEVGFHGAGSERLLATMRVGLTDLPRVRLERCEEAAVEALAGLHSLRALHLAHCRITPFVYSFVQEHDHLEELTVEGYTQANLSLFDAPRLRTLQLRTCSGLRRLQLGNLPALEELHLGGPCRLDRLEVASLETLKRVSLAGTGAIPLLSIRDLPALEELTLHNLRVRDLSLLRLPVLHTLAVSGAPLSTLTVRELPRLTAIDLGKRQNLQTITLDSLPALERLAVHRAQWLRTVTLKGVPELRELTLSECARLTPADVMALLEQTPALEKLDVRAIPRLGPVWMARAKKLQPGCEIVR